MPETRKFTVAEALKVARDALNDRDIAKAKKIHKALVAHEVDNSRSDIDALGLEIQALTSRKKLSKREFSAETERAYKFYLNGRWGEAEAVCMNVLRSNPGSSDLLNILGATQARLLKLDAAVESFNRSISIDPKRAETHLNLGGVLEQKGDAISATASCREAVKLNPNFAEAHCVLGNCLSATKKYQEAIDAYETCLSLQEGYPIALQGLSKVYMLSGDLEKGLDLKAQVEGVICFRPNRELEILSRVIDDKNRAPST